MLTLNPAEHCTRAGEAENCSYALPLNPPEVFLYAGQAVSPTSAALTLNTTEHCTHAGLAENFSRVLPLNPPEVLSYMGQAVYLTSAAGMPCLLHPCVDMYLVLPTMWVPLPVVRMVRLLEGRQFASRVDGHAQRRCAQCPYLVLLKPPVLHTFSWRGAFGFYGLKPALTQGARAAPNDGDTYSPATPASVNGASDGRGALTSSMGGDPAQVDVISPPRLPGTLGGGC